MVRYKYIIIDPSKGGVDLGHNVNGKLEKDFNLELGKAIYNKLKVLGFPVHITRSSDNTISNYERYRYVNDLVGNNKTLVISLHIDNENKDDISIISSLKSSDNTNKDIYNDFSLLGEVKNKSLINDNSKDYYVIQRVAPLNSDVVVLKIGYDYLNKDLLDISNSISDVIINYLSDQNDYLFDYENYIVEEGYYLYKIATSIILLLIY